MEKRKQRQAAKAETDSVKIHCSHSNLVDIANLIPNPRNPNKHPDRQIALLVKIIRHQGWRNPIVVSRRSGFIVKGHGRYEAAKVLNVQKVPVDIQDYENEATEYADMIADNRLHELSEMDYGTMKDLLQEIDTGALDMDLTGWDKLALEGLMTQFHPTDEMLPDALPDSELEGSGQLAGRIILVYHTQDQKAFFQNKLGVTKDKIVYTPEDFNITGVQEE